VRELKCCTVLNAGTTFTNNTGTGIGRITKRAERCFVWLCGEGIADIRETTFPPPLSCSFFFLLIPWIVFRCYLRYIRCIREVSHGKETPPPPAKGKQVIPGPSGMEPTAHISPTGKTQDKITNMISRIPVRQPNRQKQKTTRKPFRTSHDI